MRHGIKTLFLFFTILTLTGCSRLPITSKNGKLYTIAFYNTEKLFDTQNDPETDDDAFTPDGEMQWTQERYDLKIKNIASVIAGIGDNGGPAVIGLSEIENRQVLEDLISAAPLHRAGYSIVHQEMADRQGLDLALLYKPKLFKPTATQYIKVDFGEKGFASRDILQVKGELRGQLVTIYVNHWPARSRRARQEDSRLRAAAATLRREIDKQQKADPNVKIIVLGDFDAEPGDAVLEQTLKATGRPNPAFQEELFNTHYLSSVNGFGSYVYRGDFQMLDQIMVSKAMIDPQEGLEYVRGSAKIYDPITIKYTLGKFKEAPKSTYSGTVYLGGYSDHFPVFIQVRRK
ncbi:endonuclease/exonuclease/phosphatase family protein [Pontibacter mangrovi]|uniref:Endonuclease/exonuclease/phosphatase family protein n=1 Tax=Pontibacter mangrovi TaxID=2589816 RepID=A0A501W990_9BACT|nr:endonuclease/exonuclease/phosphatase family protein [Pontibacter mangrovi]TPE46169.1 endonuclease/exonuclease/phosphatase family protein [Pontibacter mangrovi]